jgi:hypothetical protein
LPEGQEVPYGLSFGATQSKLRDAGNKRHQGRFFFGFFLLAKQKKETRLLVREPD